MNITVTNNNKQYTTDDFYYHESDDVTVSEEGHVAHSHKHYEVMQVLKGDITCIIDSKIYKLKSGDVCLIRPNDFHIIQVDGKIYERRVVEFYPSALQMSQSAQDVLLHPFRTGRKKFNNFVPESVITNTPFNEIFDDISHQINYPNDETCAVRVALLLSNLLLSLHNIVDNSDADDYYKDNVCHTVINYINKNITKRITLSDMEKALNLSKYYLSHQFSKQMGMTISEFIIEKKMLYAEQLIESGIPPTEVANVVAYNYPNFYTNYKKIFGHSPKETFKKN